MTFISVAQNRQRKASFSKRCSLSQTNGIRLQASPFSSTTVAAFVSESWQSPESMATAPSTTFEPIVPDTTALLGFGAVVAISVLAAIVWNTQVVPVSRAKLALSKKSGEVKQYLDELKNSEDNTGRRFEQWLFTDWLQTNKTRKDPALPILSKAKWNSGDNPVLAATALIILGVVASAIAERVATLM